MQKRWNVLSAVHLLLTLLVLSTMSRFLKLIRDGYFVIPAVKKARSTTTEKPRETSPVQYPKGMDKWFGTLPIRTEE